MTLTRRCNSIASTAEAAHNVKCSQLSRRFSDHKNIVKQSPFPVNKAELRNGNGFGNQPRPTSERINTKQNYRRNDTVEIEVALLMLRMETLLLML